MPLNTTKKNPTSLKQLNLADSLKKDGYVVVPNLLNKYEVLKLREVCEDFFNDGGLEHETTEHGNSKYRYQPNAVIVEPKLSWVLHHPNILSVYDELLRSSVMYTCHSDIHKGSVVSNWHKDDGGRGSYGNNKGTYFGDFEYFGIDECKVIKAAVYLQDTQKNGLGLTVKKGSHTIRDLSQGTSSYVGTALGDVVFFDVRLTHRGPVFAECADNMNDRYSLFFTFGADNKYTQNFSYYNMVRQLKQGGKMSTELNYDCKKNLELQNIAIYHHKEKI